MEIEKMPARELQQTTVFVIDESTMASRYTIDAINKLLQEIMGNNDPFGGKIMLLGQFMVVKSFYVIIY